MVVGGGITGLSAAYRLAQAVEKDAKLMVDLVEGGDRLGGKILTERIDGFLVEGGPDTWLARKPEAAALCRELGLEDHLIPTNQEHRRAYVSRGARLHRLPEGMSGLVPSRITPLFLSGVLTPAGKLRAACEPFVRRQTAETEESVAAFIRRRLGREAYDYLVEPLVCGISGGDGEQLSLEAIIPPLKDMEQEYGSILRGMRLSRKAAANELAKYPTPFISLRGGVQELVDALVRRLADKVNVMLHTDATALRRRDGGLTVDLSTGESITASGIVVATPAYAAAGLLDDVNAELAEALRGIPFVSNAAVCLAFREEDVARRLNGYGYVVPRREGRLALACTWMTSKLPDRAPQGRVLLRIFLGGAGREIDHDTADDDLVDTACREIRQTMGITAQPALTRVYRHPRSMPQYTLGHLDRVTRIEELAGRTRGVYLAGNSYRGVGISDCIRSGQKAAFAVLRHLEDVGA